jgi:hypothetical protein
VTPNIIRLHTDRIELVAECERFLAAGEAGRYSESHFNRMVISYAESFGDKALGHQSVSYLTAICCNSWCVEIASYLVQTSNGSFSGAENFLRFV